MHTGSAARLGAVVIRWWMNGIIHMAGLVHVHRGYNNIAYYAWFRNADIIPANPSTIFLDNIPIFLRFSSIYNYFSWHRNCLQSSKIAKVPSPLKKKKKYSLEPQNHNINGMADTTESYNTYGTLRLPGCHQLRQFIHLHCKIWIFSKFR